MIRYALKVDDKYYALGTQFCDTLQNAHIFSSLKLATDRHLDYSTRAMYDGTLFYKDVKIITLEVNEIDS